MFFCGGFFLGERLQNAHVFENKYNMLICSSCLHSYWPPLPLVCHQPSHQMPRIIELHTDVPSLWLTILINTRKREKAAARAPLSLPIVSTSKALRH